MLPEPSAIADDSQASPSLFQEGAIFTYEVAPDLQVSFYDCRQTLGRGAFDPHGLLLEPVPQG